MKRAQVTIQLYKKGDRVLTADGPGTVLEDERVPRLPNGDVDRLGFAGNEVKIELDEPCSAWAGRYGSLETATMSPLRL